MSYIPVTPAGTLIVNLAADTEQEAIRRLLVDAAHMPYGSWKNFKRRGYSIENIPEIESQNPPDWIASGREKP